MLFRSFHCVVAQETRWCLEGRHFGTNLVGRVGVVGAEAAVVRVMEEVGSGWAKTEQAGEQGREDRLEGRMDVAVRKAHVHRRRDGVERNAVALVAGCLPHAVTFQFPDSYPGSSASSC